MAEEFEESSPGAARPIEAADPGARSMALSGASREEADAFLKRQAQFIDEQAEMLRLQKAMLEEERTLNISHLHFRRLGDLTKLAFEIAVGLVILLIVCGLGTMVWSATQDRDLVVEAFSVPQDVAQSGLIGNSSCGPRARQARHDGGEYVFAGARHRFESQRRRRSGPCRDSGDRHLRSASSIAICANGSVMKRMSRATSCTRRKALRSPCAMAMRRG